MPNPYDILRSEDNPNFFSFTTGSGILYSCFFSNIPYLSPLLGIYDLRVHDFSFYPTYPQSDDFKKKGDPRIADTIAAILRNYIDSSDRIVVYICDDSEGQQRGRARNILFEKWKAALSDIVDAHELEFYSEEDDSTIYGGIFVHKNCAFPEVVRAELIEKSQEILLEKYGH